LELNVLRCSTLHIGWLVTLARTELVCVALVGQGKPNGVRELVQISEYVRQAGSISLVYLDEINVAIIVRTFESTIERSRHFFFPSLNYQLLAKLVDC